VARPDLNPLEREFLEASRELHQREAREAHARVRRLRLLSTAASALFVVAAVVGGLAPCSGGTPTRPASAPTRP